MKLPNGTNVIIKASPEAERLAIVGKRGHVMTVFSRSNLYPVYISGYRKPFLLRADEVEAERAQAS